MTTDNPIKVFKCYSKFAKIASTTNQGERDLIKKMQKDISTVYLNRLLADPNYGFRITDNEDHYTIEIATFVMDERQLLSVVNLLGDIYDSCDLPSNLEERTLELLGYIKKSLELDYDVDPNNLE